MENLDNPTTPEHLAPVASESTAAQPNRDDTSRREQAQRDKARHDQARQEEKAREDQARHDQTHHGQAHQHSHQTHASHPLWPVQPSVNQNSEKVFAWLHDQMMELADKRVKDIALDPEANELALDLLARAELPLYIRVRAHIVLACGRHRDYLYHAREAVRYVAKGRAIFRRVTPEQALAAAELMEEAQEALRRAERDNGQLALIKAKLKDGSYVPQEGAEYGGNRTDGLTSNNTTLEEIIGVTQAPDASNGEENEDDDEEGDEEANEESDEEDDEESDEEDDDEDDDEGDDEDDGQHNGDNIGVADGGEEDVESQEDVIQVLEEGFEAPRAEEEGTDEEGVEAPDDDEEGADEEADVPVAAPPAVRRSQRAGTYTKNYRTGKPR